MKMLKRVICVVLAAVLVLTSSELPTFHSVSEVKAAEMTEAYKLELDRILNGTAVAGATLTGLNSTATLWANAMNGGIDQSLYNVSAISAAYEAILVYYCNDDAGGMIPAVGYPTVEDMYSRNNAEIIYNVNGYDCCGYDRSGYNIEGYDCEGYDKEGYNKDGYDRDGYDRTGYDKEGYNRDGYDKDGYDRSGYNREGYDREGYDKDGYDKNGCNREGYGEDGYNDAGYDIYGYDRDGYDKDGYDKDGYDKEGYDREGYDKDGYNKEGYDREGYDKEGYDKDGYDYEGYDKEGYNKDGYDRNGSYKDFAISSVTFANASAGNPYKLYWKNSKQFEVVMVKDTKGVAYIDGFTVSTKKISVNKKGYGTYKVTVKLEKYDGAVWTKNVTVIPHDEVGVDTVKAGYFEKHLKNYTGYVTAYVLVGRNVLADALLPDDANNYKNISGIQYVIAKDKNYKKTYAKGTKKYTPGKRLFVTKHAMRLKKFTVKIGSTIYIKYRIYVLVDGKKVYSEWMYKKEKVQSENQ